MSTALLQELHQELRRLYIAGSDLASGDFRLKRLLPQFGQLGERAAVFKRLGDGILSLVESDGGQGTTAAVQLQELTLLLESVLYTQGVSSPDREPGMLQSVDFPLGTTFSYRKLAAVRQALTTTGGGRYEIITEAYKEGLFQDLRLLLLTIPALNDPYNEIAEFVTTDILPSYGPEIARHLITGLDLTGGKTEVRKLRVIAKTGCGEVASEVMDAAWNGTDEIRVAAIECITGHGEYTAELLEWTKDKKKVVREAAYTALAAGETPQGRDTLYEAFLGKDRGLAADALAKWPSEELSEKLAVLFSEELRQAPHTGENEDKKKKIAAYWNKMEPFLTVFAGVRSPQLEEIFSDVLREYKRFSSLGWIPLIDCAARYLEQSTTSEALKLLHDMESEDLRYLPSHFRAAQLQLSPRDVFKQFTGSILDKLKSIVSKEAKQREELLLETIRRQIDSQEVVFYKVAWSVSRTDRLLSREFKSADKIAADWDSRWLDWFLERDAVDMVCAFARPGHSGVRNYLLDKLQEQGDYRRDHHYYQHIFMGLERAGMEESRRLDLLISTLENDKTYHPYVFDFYLFNMMLQFPVSYIDRIDGLRSIYSYECIQQIDFLIQYLQRTNK
ncbi:HEAT repeat domain-containing protein [Paenibacillus sp. sgz500958]|uniref:HEAT repeat domain-containing protein n=1 Tax=Paenibacillus sp. sgz500958 TaxID=3242475 RepID=UPI0036D2D8DE